MSEIRTPFECFRDTDGTPLDGGYVYIGVENQEPITHPANVYWDADLTIAATQPIRTLGGYPVRAGAPAKVYASGGYSICVKNKNREIVTYAVSSGSLEALLADATSASRGAGSVGYSSSVSYPAGTVGAALQSSPASASLTYAEAQAETYTAFTAAGTAPAYTLTPSPSVSSLTTQAFMVTFAANGTTGSNTLNVSGLGAVALKQCDASGALVDGVVKAGFIAKVKYNGTYWVILNPLPSATATAGRLLGVTYYAAGTSAYVKGTNNPTFIVVEGCGGGGSGIGGAATPGGYSGGYFRKKILASALAASETVTVGAGGAAVKNTNGNAGGTTSFGSHVSATGGSGGGGVYTPGTATGGDLNCAGMHTSTSAGAPSYFGGGGAGASGNADAGGAPGAGGGACTTTTYPTYYSGAGADGILIVYEYS